MWLNLLNINILPPPQYWDNLLILRGLPILQLKYIRYKQSQCHCRAQANHVRKLFLCRIIKQHIFKLKD